MYRERDPNSNFADGDLCYLLHLQGSSSANCVAGNASIEAKYLQREAVVEAIDGMLAG